MSNVTDCGVCFVSDDCFDPPEFSSRKNRRARKEHRCCECGGIIKRGEVYEYVAGMWERAIDSFKTCLVCVEIRTSFSCNGRWLFHELYERMEEDVFPLMTTGCLEKLSTAAAKNFLVDRWNAWKFGRKMYEEEQ